MIRPRRRASGALAVAGLCLLASDGHTANELKRRVPPIWTGVECMQVVDRSTDPVVHVEYSVAQNDPDPDADDERGEDELSDSRTHQFFAFAGQEFDMWGENAAATPLPVWINDDDIQRVADKEVDYPPPPQLNLPELTGPSDVEDEEVLERGAIWPSKQWVRITADDDRRAIATDVAAMGFDWDTSDVEAGTWLVAGYVFEPRANIWKVRPEAIKVVDDPDDRAAVGPAAFLSAGEQIASPGDTVTVEGCIDAMDGSTLRLDLSEPRGGTMEPEWFGVLEAEVENGAFEADVELPACIGRPLTDKQIEDGVRSLVKFRLAVEDPEGRTYTAYSPDPVAILDATDTECTDADFPDLSQDDGAGCSCRARARTPLGSAAAALLLVAWARRRRRR